MRRQAVEPCTVKLDRASRHLAALGVQDSRDRLKRGRLPSSIGAEQCRDRRLFGAERDALEYKDDIVVDDLHIVDRQHYHASATGWSGRARSVAGPVQVSHSAAFNSRAKTSG